MTSLAALNPIDNPSSWDVVEIGGVQSPGRCSWTGWKRHNQWDRKRGKGTRGSTQTLVQQPEAEGEFTFYLWDNGNFGTGHNHFAEWDKFSPLLQYDPTKRTPQAINIFHPALATLDPPVTSVVIEDVGALTPEGGDGMFTITVKMSEFFPVPPKKAVGTPTTSKDAPAPTSPGAQPPAAQDEYQKQIAELLKKAQEP